LLLFGLEDEKVEVEEKVTEALDENFDKHDKIAKIHKGEELNGGVHALTITYNVIDFVVSV
jgi:hypothetical protein